MADEPRARESAGGMLSVLTLRARLRFERVWRPRGGLFAVPLRGALGRALRPGVCVAPGRPCDGCPWRGACLFALLFEEVRPEDRWRGAEAAPKPFALFVEEDGDADLSPRDRLAVGFTLLGPAARGWTQLLLALARAGRDGVGRERVPFRLERVDDVGPAGEETALVVGDPPRFAAGGAPAARAPAAFASEHAATGTFRLRLLSPLRLLRRGRLVESLPFETVLRAAARRLRAVASIWAERARVPALTPELLAEARRVDLVREDLRRVKVVRWSARQGRSHPLHGLLGEVGYRGDPRPFAPWLGAAVALGLGKATTFGFGRVAYETKNRSASRATERRGRDAVR